MKPGKYFFLLIFFMVLFAGACEMFPEEGTVYGAWTCYETGPFGASTFMVDISESPSVPDKIEIFNFSQLGFSVLVTADVDGNNITIPQQTVSDGVSSFHISGTGYSTDQYKTMYWNYLIDGETYSANLIR